VQVIVLGVDNAHALEHLADGLRVGQDLLGFPIDLQGDGVAGDDPRHAEQWHQQPDAGAREQTDREQGAARSVPPTYSPIRRLYPTSTRLHCHGP
jgi:hypothetical protein